MFEPLPARFDFVAAEREVLRFWEEQRIFERTLEQRRAQNAPLFVFYEGPPTANGLPHPGHCLTRAMKDLFPRYQTMCGKLVERKAGWDTHGLPVEVEVCKELGIHTKEEIEAYGVEKFNLKCIQSVFRYTREWEEMTRRLGFWVNLKDAYVTYHQSYVESVWWSLKTLFERGLLYQGHKVVWWWPQAGTALSSGEVGEGYRTVDDPSVFVKFPLVDESDGATERGSGEGEEKERQKASLLVWTTTPWTLVSNHFAAVNPELEYALVHDATTDERLYIAAELVETIARKVKHELTVLAHVKGSTLVGKRYLPPFAAYYDHIHGEMEMYFGLGMVVEVLFGKSPGKKLGELQAELKDGGSDYIGWRVLAADFVTTESGTGLVHEAPAFGEVDFNLLQKERQRFADPNSIPLLCAVAPNGTFTPDAGEKYVGRNIKECDKEIIRELKERGLLYHQETIKHEYPFAPRAEKDALIQYARKSWFVRTSEFKDEFLKNNAQVNWLPEHIKEGRFGDFLRNNVDWALSRERFWGTPLPVWVCEQTGKMEAVGSLAELMAKPGATDGGYWERKVAEHRAAGEELPEHLRVHKPYIDEWTYDSPFAQGSGMGDRGLGKARMRRVPEVIDCWWDAGSMPFAQWGYPHASGSIQTFARRFPAAFISEAIDQTRGWFYGLLSISTLLFSEAAMEAGLAAIQPDRMRRTSAKGLAEGALTDEMAAQVRANAARMEARLELPPHALPMEGDDFDALADVAMEYPLPFRTCIVLGHMMGEDGLKMSKRLRNYKEPSYIFNTLGADAMRWYFFSAQAPWTTTRFVEASIRDSHREFLVKLYNVLSFFTIYASIDRFEVGRHQGTPARRDLAPERKHEGEIASEHDAQASDSPRGTGWRAPRQRSELDRWVLSELHRAIRLVREKMDAFENFPAAGRLNDFVDALSNWYVRRSRDRFWNPVHGDASRDQDKWDAYNTLYEVLLTLSKLIAPFTPFFAEVMYGHLVGTWEGGKVGRDENAATFPHSNIPTFPHSAHLCDYPVADESLIDEDLAAEMDLVREIVSAGRAARTESKLKVRQPLSRVEIVLANHDHESWLRSHAPLIAEELNVKAVDFATSADQYVTYQIKPNFKAMGPKFGKLAPQIAAALQKVDAAASRQALASAGELSLEIAGQHVTLTPAEVEIRLEARPGWAAAPSRAGVVVLSTELTPELREEGLIRELIHHVQNSRKEQNLPYEQRIALYIAPDEPGAAELPPSHPLRQAVQRYESLIHSECLAKSVSFSLPAADVSATPLDLEGHRIRLYCAPR